MGVRKNASHFPFRLTESTTLAYNISVLSRSGIMYISLQSLRSLENKTFTKEQLLHMDELCDEVSQLKDLQPIHVKVVVSQMTHKSYHLKVNQKTKATLTCSRCLANFTMPLESDWETQVKLENGWEQDGDEEKIDLQDNKLDLTPRIREALLLQIPFAPLCREDCKGLCPVCGVDRNQQPCRCHQETIDPRLAELKKLL